MTRTPAPHSEAHGRTDRTGPVTMHAAVADRYGPPGRVGIRTVDRPVAGEGEVVVEVSFAGLSRAALHLTTGTPYLLRLAGFGFRAPRQPVGNELSGTVVAVGPGVRRFSVGDEVFGYGRGTCAEFTVAEEEKLAHRPGALPAERAAALVDSASTALQAVRDRGAVQADQRVLVLGASGGVGSFAVQVAAAEGAEVTGTASTAKVDFVRSLGAHHVIDHTTTDPLAAGPFDVIVDIGGRRPVRALRRALTAEGTLVMVGGEGGGPVTGGFQRQLLAPLRAAGSRQTVRTFVTEEHHRHLEDLAHLAVDGHLAPAVDVVHPLEHTARGLGRMEAGEIRGKDVVAVAGPAG